VKAAPIAIGRSVIPLNKLWKFHTGDNPRWANPGFDDSQWENVDLTPAAGAHDGDVGLTGYVPGWGAKGHAGYSGYAWYRMRVSLTPSEKESLALTGPPDVDDAYQLFINGTLAGSAGDFSGKTPVVYSIQPRMFTLPESPQSSSETDSIIFVIAIRVWVSAGSIADDPAAGGIHIAPALGEKSAIEALYYLEWLQTFCGYVVDAVEPLLFIALAIMAFTLAAFDRSKSSYLWFGLALLLLALVRSNQVFYYWMQFESTRAFDIATSVILMPLVLGCWIMAWRTWFRLTTPALIPEAVVVLTLLYMLSQLLGLWWVWHEAGIFNTVSNCLRLLFAALLIFIAYSGIRHRGREGWLALPAVILISTGLFARELSEIHIPGIWFPYGVGVSRTQFAYAAFDVVMFVLLLLRLLSFSKGHHPISSQSTLG